MSNIYGDISGVKEGDLFSKRKDLHHIGIHRPLQSGICGTASNGGAESIVVSGGYEDDRDYGEEIIYIGHGGNKNGKQISDQVLTRGNLALATNVTSGNLVRVIRGANGDAAHSPADGYRYDGLYYVRDYGFKRGESGFQIIWFRLVKASYRERVSSSATTSSGQTTPGRRQTTISRIIRDTNISKSVKKMHKYRCQICGESLETPIGPYAEAAHIKPLGRPHSGCDTPENILCLCPNDHVLFDRGSVHILEDLTVVKSGGLTSKLHTVRSHNIDVTFLEYHRKNFGFG